MGQQNQLPNKEQAIHNFWSQFNWPAYDQNTTPDDAPVKHITYNVQVDALDQPVMLMAQLWDRSSSWADITAKLHEIESVLKINDSVVYPLSNGLMRVMRGSPFAQRVSDPDDSTRSIYINIIVEFLTAE